MAGATYHHGNLREALLDRAELVIETDGADALSLRQLARDLGVSHAAPARHFRDRQALLDALALRGFDSLNAALVRAAAGGADDRARFRAVGLAYVAFAVDHPALLGAMYDLKHRPGADELRAAGESALALTRRLIEDAQRAGSLGPGDPQAFAYTGVAGLHGVATLVSEGFAPDVDPAILIDTVVGVLWAGMGGSP